MLNRAICWGSLSPGKQTLGVDDCWALQHGKTYILEHPDTKPLCSHLSISPDSSYLCVPISASSQILGVLHLSRYSEKEDTTMTTSRQMLADRVTKHHALVLVNLRLRETLRMEAIRDPLTNLYNRRYMEESLERETQRAKRHNASVGIIMVDIDHFKRFNDTYGHEAGDAVLRELGSLFRRHTRSEDIACRYGGEEFLLIMPEAPLKIVEQRAEELRVIVKDLLRIQWQGKTLNIKVSIGVAAFPNHGHSVKNIVNAADTALYQAKKSGRNQVVVAS
jgi:diguanylate cyclase (GGDEF)-like protein